MNKSIYSFLNEVFVCSRGEPEHVNEHVNLIAAAADFLTEVQDFLDVLIC
jgi:hypothetical protein